MCTTICVAFVQRVVLCKWRNRVPSYPLPPPPLIPPAPSGANVNSMSRHVDIFANFSLPLANCFLSLLEFGTHIHTQSHTRTHTRTLMNSQSPRAVASFRIAYFRARQTETKCQCLGAYYDVDVPFYPLLTLCHHQRRHFVIKCSTKVCKRN